jgi:septal ring factor EnvC (AmiA/AmiB activator)
MELDPRHVIETEIKSMKETIQKLENILINTETSLAANKILLQGLEDNLSALPEQSEFEIVED